MTNPRHPDGYTLTRRLWRRFRPRILWRLLFRRGRITHRYVRAHGLEIRNGAFAGVRYPPAAIGRASALPAKLLGSYERETVPALEELVSARPELIVNIGAGEGIYAVGLAVRCPQAKVLAFESDRGQRRLCRRMAELNGVEDRVEVRGTFTRAHLARLPEGATAFVLDCEGAEIELLQPHARFVGSRILVEVHPAVEPRAAELIARRFADTHSVQPFAIAERDPNAHAVLRGWAREDAELALSEDRGLTPGTVAWLLLSPIEA